MRDCISNAEHSIKRKGIPAYNYAVITGSFFWLSDGEAPFDVRRPKAVDNKVSVSMKGMGLWSRLLFLWVFPILALGYRNFYLDKKKRKIGNKLMNDKYGYSNCTHREIYPIVIVFSGPFGI